MKLLPVVFLVAAAVGFLSLIAPRSVEDDWEDAEELVEEPQPCRPEVRRFNE